MKPAVKNTDYRLEFFENSEMLISIYDKDLILIDANRAFIETLNLNKEEIIGKNISVISPDCISSGRYKIYEHVIKTGERKVFDEVRLAPSLGGIFVRISAFKVGEGLGISTKNITDLVETIDDLETFIYKTSHDIRSPISTTLGLINIASIDLEENKAANDYLKLIKSQTELLDQVVKQLAETIAIRTAQLNLEPIVFEQLIENILAGTYELMNAKKMQCEIDVKAYQTFTSDKNLIKIILQHLIDNAIKYRDESKNKMSLALRIRPYPKGVKIDIEDNGIGIHTAFQKDVFKMFYRATNKSNGRGLGLFIVKQCVKKLGGQITLNSQPGQGTTFHILIPDIKKP